MGIDGWQDVMRQYLKQELDEATSLLMHHKCWKRTDVVEGDEQPGLRG